PSRIALNEFKDLRYSAVDVDPSEFTDAFQLRQQELGRKIELLIVITMFDEEEYLFARTVAAVFANIQYLCENKRAGKMYPEFWGSNDSWEKIVVCVVCDGKKKLHPKTKSLLEAMGCYQAAVEIKGSQAHIYEVFVSLGVRDERILLTSVAHNA